MPYWRWRVRVPQAAPPSLSFMNHNKHKPKPNPSQWGFSACLKYCLDNIPKEDQQRITRMHDGELHPTLGRWIRNNCKLWEFGTDRAVDDAIHLFKSGIINPKSLRTGELIHPELEVTLDQAHQRIRGVDYSLNHPDNISGIITETLQAIIKGDLRLEDIKRHERRNH